MADTKTVSTAAMAALTTALLNGDTYYADDDELGITLESDMDVIRELVSLLRDVTVQEWGGPGGGYSDRWRSYKGTLPSGLRLDVITSASAELILTGPAGSAHGATERK